jgi:exodeoxyribonuclease V alpha subunit
MRAHVSRKIYENPDNGYTVISCFTKLLETVPEKARTKTYSSGCCFTVIGMFLPTREDTELELEGHWETNHRGTSFCTDHWTEIMPKTKSGLSAYLSSGMIKGIGPKLAQAIVGKFGLRTLDIMDNDPQQLLTIRGINESKLEGILRSYQESRGVRELMAFLGPHGISAKKCVRIQKQFEGRAIHVLKEEPYLLCNVHGFGFLTADKIARSLHTDPADPLRIQGAICYVLEENLKEGNVYLERMQLIERTLTLLNNDYPAPVVFAPQIKQQTNALVQGGRLCYEVGRIYLAEDYQAERTIAKAVASILSSDALPPFSEETLTALQAEMEMPLAEAQQQAVRMAMEHPLSILTGGPGTGKTTTLRVILEAYQQTVGGEILLAAPTGRASRRMAESCGLPAATLHKALGILISDDESPCRSTDDLPLSADFIVVDESSMLDLHIAEKLFSRLKPGARLLLVGDADQLPPVGPGNVFRDLIDSKLLPVTRLTTVFRQAGGSRIAINADTIKKGGTNLLYGDDFQFIPTATPEETAEVICKLYQKELTEADLSKVQVLTPLRKNGAVSVNGLNPMLHNLVNPLRPTMAQITYGPHEYRVGDKVMQTKNSNAASNGDIGYITDAYTDEDGCRSMTVHFLAGESVSFTQESLDMLDWAYAMSVHKSQGAEYQTVLVPALFAFRAMLRRDLYYTAITRAKRKVILVGQLSAFYKAIHTPPAHRNTTLAARICARVEMQRGSQPATEETT